MQKQKKAGQMLQQTELVKSVKQFANRYSFIKAVYLFGSVAKAAAQKSSDIDLAIICNRDISGWERIDLENEVSNLICADADLTVFHQANPLLQHQILLYGKLIHETDREARVKQVSEARYEYLDTRYLYKELGNQ